MRDGRQLRFRHVGLAILGLGVATTRAADATGTSAVIAALDRTIMVRAGRDGKTYGEHEVDPLLWPDSTYFLAGESRRRLVAALDAVNQLADADVRRCPPAQRAFAQNRVWTVFDYVTVRPERSRSARDREFLHTLAAAMAKLALAEKEIAAIPDPLAAAAESGRWPVAPQGKEQVEIFLPPGVATDAAGWTTLARENGEVVAPNHARTFEGRSVFTLHVRFPADGPKVADYFQRLAESATPWVAPDGMNSLQLNPDLPNLPVDTELALVRRLAVVGRDGRWHATPLTLSVQLRHYWVTSREACLKLSRDAERRTVDPQSFTKFELDPASFARGEVGELRALKADEPGFGFLFAHSFDQVDGAGGFPDFKPGPQHETMRECFQCHSQPGLGSLNSFAFFTRTVPLPHLVTPEAGREAAATENWKTSRAEWGMLQAFWPLQSAH